MAYPENILKYLRKRARLDENDTSLDEHFNKMRKDAVFEEVLRWQGIYGWGGQIRGWIQDIYGVELNKEEENN